MLFPIFIRDPSNQIPIQLSTQYELSETGPKALFLSTISVYSTLVVRHVLTINNNDYSYWSDVKPALTLCQITSWHDLTTSLTASRYGNERHLKNSNDTCWLSFAFCPSIELQQDHRNISSMPPVYTLPDPEYWEWVGEGCQKIVLISTPSACMIVNGISMI